MKSALVLAAAIVMAMPVVSVPTVSDAQVLTGRARAAPARRARPAPPRLSEAEENQLWDAQSEIGTVDEQIAAVQAAGQAQGALTPEQQAQLNAHNARRTELQAVVTRLEAKQNR
ncbi:hypothetical protein [Brevundimonas sp. Root1423]|uniref:hypothetical protein n=1 Tax=Brevundimonas sp. Root1423 TaxID=1736462 RepID=UPI0006F472FC|nr:hypothetical protein [Brevundimonas sp. Root1423]KQY84573.1 hypothetical protein ASD25_05860 [Brevundimonas sp. Root1423]